MLKQALTTGIISLGFMIATPAMAHNISINYHNHDFQIIQPVHQPRPVQHCVNGAKVNKMQANQQRRIQRGMRKGQLVKWEVKKLKKQQHRIRKSEQQMRHSGHCLTRQEAKQLIHRLGKANQKIHNLKRNNVRRGHGHGHNHHRRGEH